MKEYLPLISLWRLLGVVALSLLPHVLRLPLWASASIAAVIGWRALAAARQWPLPSGWIRFVLMSAALGGVYLQYGRVSGQQAGTTLLCLMAALKLLELKSRRDVMVIIFLTYFLLVTHFLHEQALWTLAYLLGCVLAITAVLIECQHRGALPPRRSLKTASVLLAQALPLALLMFVLFPRIPGPIWGLPADAGAARSGLSDSMSPGDISSLILSDAVAFRVEFEGPLPAVEARYWRGPVFDHFDGRSWQDSQPKGRRTQRLWPSIHGDGSALSYTTTLEPQRHHWLFALDAVDPSHLPADAYLGAGAQLLSEKRTIERRRYRLKSHPQYRLDAATPASDRSLQRFLQLPDQGNPRARALAADWRARLGNDAQIIQQALRQFREQAFVYTLRPPPLGRHSVDEFLFESRRGFCEHYASSFTFLMRAAGIPARVVTGYLGGELNPLGDYLVIRQSDAHAWSEVWLPDTGWQRIDPTAAVAPERVERGLADVLDLRAELPDFLAHRGSLRAALARRWDWVNARWNGWVLGYGPELQRSFLSRFGLGEVRDMLLALTAAVTAGLGLIGLMLLRQSRPAANEDVALRLWRRLQRKLTPFGLTQSPAEGPLAFARRSGRQSPMLAEPLQEIVRLYLALRYQAGDARTPGPDRDQLLSALAAAIDRLPGRTTAPRRQALRP